MDSSKISNSTEERGKYADGIWCLDALALLSDYLSQVLPAHVVQHVDRHLSECDACSSIGGEFASLFQELTESLGNGEPLDSTTNTQFRMVLAAMGAAASSTE